MGVRIISSGAIYRPQDTKVGTKGWYAEISYKLRTESNEEYKLHTYQKWCETKELAEIEHDWFIESLIQKYKRISYEDPRDF